jgi:hypothetical protein
MNTGQPAVSPGESERQVGAGGAGGVGVSATPLASISRGAPSEELFIAFSLSDHTRPHEPAPGT